MFDSNQFFSGGAAGFYPTTIDQSLRFEDGDNAYLSRTPSTAGNRKTFTWSGWVKRGNLGTYQAFFSAANSDASNPRSSWQFRDNDTLYVGFNPDGGTWRELITTAVYRDTSAWYHIVVAVDTTQATESNRVKLYVNGEQITDFSTEGYPPQNEDLTVNNTIAHSIGRYQAGTSSYVDMYMAEVHFTDGTSYTADDFGELKSGIWVPKAPSVTYGTNGFKLTFEDSAAIGDDTSGNGNDFTVNNLVASDVVLDSPTNNFAVLNPVSKNGSEPAGTKEGNTHFIITGGSNYCSLASTIGASSGKWYCEGVIKASSAIGSARTGGGVLRYDDPRNDFIGAAATGWGYGSNGTLYNLGNNVTGASSLAVNDVFMLAIDLDAGKLWVGKNGTWESSGDPAAGTGEQFSNLTGDGEYFFGAWGYTTSDITAMNFGQDSTFAGLKTAGGNSDANGIGDFAYAPPSGYLALSTANLPDPAIDPAQGSSPEDYFNTVLYTGDGTDNRSITGVGFQPDWVWLKTRNQAFNNQSYDAVRGANQRLVINTTQAEATKVDNMQAFETDGFQVGTDADVNFSGGTFVAWNWKANGSGVSNTDGSITSTVSANTEAGFSIVGWTGTGSNEQIGHGLGAEPDFIIAKNRDKVDDWAVYHSSTADAYTLLLNSTSAGFSGSAWANSANNNSETFNIGSDGRLNESGNNIIAYCFHSVEGYSKFGSYTGNGSATDGSFIYTGFRPAFVITKVVSGTTGQWSIKDTARNPYNTADGRLSAESSNAESSDWDMDILSNGFKWYDGGGTTNGSGNTYIYMAFAENPFKYSNAR